MVLPRYAVLDSYHKFGEGNTVTLSSRKFNIYSQVHRLPTFDDDGGGIKYQ